MLWLCAATLLIRLLVPAGYMIGIERGRVAIVPCPGQFMAVPMAHDADGGTMIHHAPGMGGDRTDHRHPHGDHERAAMPCAFAGLTMAGLGAIDPILLVALIAFVLARGMTATRLPPATRFAYIRPPLRGPPALG